MNEDEKATTVGDLKAALQGYPDDCELYFGGLTFYRLKRRDEKLVQVEFGEVVYRDKAGKLRIEEVDPNRPK